MKKILAMLVAMMMVFSCVFALAEETGAPALPAVSLESIPEFTVTSDLQVNTEAALKLLTEKGAPEEVLGVAQMILPFLADLSEKFVYANKGVQYDLSLQDTNIFNLSAEMTENGFALATDLVPSYTLTITNETIQKLIQQISEQYQGQINDIMSKIDMELLQSAAEKLMGYVAEMAQAGMAAVTFGEPVKDEYVFDDITFNTKTPVAVDLPMIKDGLAKLVQQIFTDETIVSAIQSVAEAIPGATIDLSNPPSLNDVPAEQMPDMTGFVYTITDDEGIQTVSDTYILLNVVAKDEAQTTVDIGIYLTDTSVDVNVSLPAQETAVQVFMTATENGAVAEFAISSPVADVDQVITFSMNEDGAIEVDCALYVDDLENPLLTAVEIFAFGGERNVTVLDESRPVLALDDLADEEKASEIGSALLGDVVMNGISTVVGNISAVLPEQGQMLQQLVGQLMGSFMGAGTEAVPAE